MDVRREKKKVGEAELTFGLDVRMKVRLVELRSKVLFFWVVLSL